MKGSKELMVHAPLLKLGYNVPAPSPYIMEKEQELMPKEEIRDAYYEVAPTIAGLSLNDRRSLIRALIITLLTPIQIETIDDFLDEHIVDFTMWMRRNPGFESKDTEEQRIKAYSKFLAKCGTRDFEIQQHVKKMAKKVLGELADVEGIDKDELSDLLNDDDND